MDKAMAENILEIAERDMYENGEVSYQTVMTMMDELKKTGKNVADYFYPEGTGNRVLFNSLRWKRHFIEDRT